MSNEFGEFIRKKRKEQGMNLRTLANLTEKSASYISSIETGKRSAPSNAVLEKFAEILCLDNRDKTYMLDLAAKSKSKPAVAIDLVAYINENRLIQDVLRFSEEHKVEITDWKNFINTLKEKY
ncbi:MAG: helix-turn-helix domain-containing protein [Ruminococcus sp.]